MVPRKMSERIKYVYYDSFLHNAMTFTSTSRSLFAFNFFFTIKNLTVDLT